MKKLVLFIVLINSIISFAQTSEEFNVILFPQGYGLKLLNSSGNSSIVNDVSNIGFLNPASISQFENYSFGISYQLSTSIDEAWIADIGTSRVYNFYPQSFGAIAKLNDFTFGLGFGQKYNGTVDMDPIPVTTVQDPDGTGEYFTVVEENSIQSYSLSTSYSLKELLDISNDISVGVRYSLNRFNQNVELWKIKASADGFYSSFGLGVNSEFRLDQERKMFIGLFYESANRFRADIEYDDNSLLPNDLDPIYNQNYTKVSSVLLYCTPSELKFDLTVDATPDLKFLTNLTTVFWESEKISLKDQIEFSTSAVYRINEIFSPSLGFYFTDHKYKDNFYSRLNSELGAFFITAGLKLNFKMFYADLAIADSHLFSGDFRKQTIGKLALGISL